MTALPPPIVGFFDDADPEDAWSASDTLAEQLLNLDRRLQHMDARPDMDEVERHARLFRLRQDLRHVTGRIVRATAELFGPDLEREGRVLDLPDLGELHPATRALITKLKRPR